MARPSWLITNPETSGSGNGKIKNSAAEHTGRVAREGVVTVTATGLQTPKTYKVTQSPKSEFVSFTDGSEMAASKDGGVLKITGKSNALGLNFAWVGDSGGVSLPANYTAHGIVTTNNSNIDGDPGASAEYNWEISLNIPENETVEEIIRTIKVTTKGGVAAQIAIKQTAGDLTLEIEPFEITIPQAGTPAVDVNVTSNTTWEIS